jgi:type I restriction enzyme S subunit
MVKASPRQVDEPPKAMPGPNVPKGYKQADIGVIPEDWEAKTLGEIGQSLIGLTYKPSDVRSDGILVLRASNIQEGSLHFDDNVFVEMEVPSKIMAKPGDILICVRNGSRELIGKCALLDERAKGMTFGAFMAVFRTPPYRFVYQQFQSSTIKRQIHEHLGATINQITNKSLNSFSIPLPSEEDEQEAIAEALSDADALIESLEELIAKKRQTKQGAMQELLTGKKRLPGFKEDWQKHSFDEIAHPRGERIDPRHTEPQGFCIELEHIEQGTGRLLGHTETSEESSLKSIFQKEDVLFGKLRAYLRKFWLASTQGLCSTEIWVFAANRALITPQFLFQLVTSDSFIQSASSAYGTHMPRSDWNVVRNYEVSLPPLPEQAAIAAILSDIDEEITAMEKKLAKARQIKQGMMQELLTGRIRLV